MALKSKKIVGRMLEKIRKRRAESKLAFAEWLGVSRQYYQQIKDGQQYPKYSVFVLLQLNDIDVRPFFKAA